MTEELDFEECFDDLFVELEKIDYEEHPPVKVLEDYLAGDLEDDGNESFSDKQALANFLKGKPQSWKLSEVSLHVATCERCAKLVSRLRVEELTQAKQKESWLWRKPQERIVAFDLSQSSVYVPLIASTAVALLLFFTNLLMNNILPPNASSLVPGAGSIVHFM